MNKYETQITVWMDNGGKMWYTAWYRKVYFLFRGKWKEIEPTNVDSYGKAVILTGSYNFPK